MLFLFVLSTVCIPPITTLMYDDALQLSNKLMENYSTSIIPKLNQSESMKVNLTIKVMSINDIDDISGFITMMVSLEMNWQDDLLRWTNLPNFQGISSLDFPASDIWIPPLSITNSGNDEYAIKIKNEDRTMASVSKDGSVALYVGKEFTAMCNLDMNNYPSDEHECELELSALISEEKLSINPSINTDTMSENSQWKLKSVNIEIQQMKDYPVVLASFNMQRRPAILINGLFVPIFILGVMNLFVFLMPLESGERVSFSMTVLLSLAVFLTIVSEKMPQSAVSIPRACIYLVIMLAYSCLISFSNIVVLAFHHSDDESFTGKFLKCCRSLRKNSNVIHTKVKSVSAVGNCYKMDMVLLCVFTAFLLVATIVILLPVFV